MLCLIRIIKDIYCIYINIFLPKCRRKRSIFQYISQLRKRNNGETEMNSNSDFFYYCTIQKNLAIFSLVVVSLKVKVTYIKIKWSSPIVAKKDSANNKIVTINDFPCIIFSSDAETSFFYCTISYFVNRIRT